MTGRKKQFEISKKLWSGLKNLQKRYNKPMIQIADGIFDTADLQLLDELMGLKRKERG